MIYIWVLSLMIAYMTGFWVGRLSESKSEQTQLKESPKNFNKDSAPESMLNADLISRRAAVSVANDFDATQVVRGLEKLPSVMPTQIIQCKDCKHLYQDGECPLRLWKTHVEDDFCSHGERR